MFECECVDVWLSPDRPDGHINQVHKADEVRGHWIIQGKDVHHISVEQLWTGVGVHAVHSTPRCGPTLLFIHTHPSSLKGEWVCVCVYV